MKFPSLTELNASREMIDVFGGYNHNLRIGEGEFYDMKNLTSADYPVLSPRAQRGVYVPGNVEDTEAVPPTNPLCIIAKDALCYVTKKESGIGYTFHINGKKVDYTGDVVNPGQKTLISMGSYVIIMPDKYYINTLNHEDKGFIERSVSVADGTAQFSLCKLDGEGYDLKAENISSTAPTNPTDSQLWLDTSGSTHMLKQYSKTNSQWVAVATTYIKISFPNMTGYLNDVFSNEDGLTISGIESSKLKDINNKTMIAWEVGKDYIIVTGILDQTVTQTLSSNNKITISRKMPEVDFVIEAGNRLWGCHYGKTLNGEVVNEIYASKLGDFKNWNSFASISTDSYVASVGTDGQFTGAITHLGYPIFFKENCMHKVYGNYPANFQIQTTACRGVQKGCHKSLAIVNETLFYKSRSAVCAYDGSLPIEVSSALGDIAYSDAVAGVLGNKYYISMKDANGEYHLFVFDTQKGMWHREDNTQATDFCSCDGELYYIDYDDKQIKTVRGTGIRETKPIEWEATTGIIGTGSPDKKYISRIIMRLSLEIGTKLYMQVEYDSSGAWEQIFAMSASTLKTFSIPIRPKRCDHLRLKLIGEGDAKIFSITKTIEQGSDL